MINKIMYHIISDTDIYKEKINQDNGIGSIQESRVNDNFF